MVRWKIRISDNGLKQLLNATRIGIARYSNRRLEKPITHCSITTSDVKYAMEGVSVNSAPGTDGTTEK